MTRILLLALLLLAAPTLLPSAAAQPCPTYTYRVATADLGAQSAAQNTAEFNEQGQVKLTLVKSLFYVTVDEVGSDGWVVAYFVYQEQNGQGGLQRSDEYCQDEGSADRGSDALVA